MIRFVLLTTLVLVVASSPAYPQWTINGTPVVSTVGSQDNPTMIPDGAGGAIVTWNDSRGSTSDIYAQRINAFGAVQWTANGALVCNSAGQQMNPAIIADASGGAIITWMDSRGADNDIYAQRITAAGVPVWTANGVPISTATSGQTNPCIISDGSGSAIIAWTDARGGATTDVYAQRINSSGAVQWTANGVALCTATGDQNGQVMVTDGSGGAIVGWADNRVVYDIYAQRINSAGTAQWTANGVAICTATGQQASPVIASDGSGGAILTWADARSGTNDIYAQRVNSSGAPQWTGNGTGVCVVSGSQADPAIVSDGAGGAIIAWDDNRAAGSFDIYAQRLNSAGGAQWIFNGTALCSATGDQVLPALAPDGTNGAIVAWIDNRNGAQDVFAQRIAGTGVIQWEDGGESVSSAALNQTAPKIVVDAQGEAIVCWVDARTGTNDVFAERMETRLGYWGHPEPVVTAVADITHDQGGSVKVNWTASGRDITAPKTIDYYSIWRATDVAPVSGGLSVILKDPVKLPDNPRGPVYAQFSSASNYYWELIGKQQADALSAYTFTASTRADSVLGAPANVTFMVAATSIYDVHSVFFSNAMTGHSVDNLAPAAPLLLTAQRAGNAVYLKWDRVHVNDLKNYSVYRKTSAGVTPMPGNFLTNAADTVLTDATPPATAAYYIVTANDLHMNQSVPSNEASVQASTGVGNTPPISGLTVLDHYPNPFSQTATVDVGLPSGSTIEVTIYDVAGRLVARQVTQARAKGWQHLTLDARDATGNSLPSGVYFYHVKASGQTVARKMVIAR